MGMGQARSGTVIAFAMNDATIKRLIAEIASDSTRVIFTPHAKQAMRRRRVLPTQVIQVLLKGTIYEPAHRDVYGCWKCTLQRTVSGDVIRVAAALGEDDLKNKVVVITVMR